MPAHPDRVRSNYEEAWTCPMRGPVSSVASFSADIRRVLDYCEAEYVGPEVNAALKRLREVVGYGQ